MKPPSLVVLDTNVWLDNYIPQRSCHTAVKELVYECLTRNITLAYVATSIKDVFYCFQREFKRIIEGEGEGAGEGKSGNKVAGVGEGKGEGSSGRANAAAINELAWACIGNMSEIAVALTVAEPQIAMARHYKKLDYDLEDDIIIASLTTANADFFITHDKTLLKKCPVAALSAQDFLAVLGG